MRRMRGDDTIMHYPEKHLKAAFGAGIMAAGLALAVAVPSALAEDVPTSSSASASSSSSAVSYKEDLQGIAETLEAVKESVTAIDGKVQVLSDAEQARQQAEPEPGDYADVVNPQVAGDFFFLALVDTVLLFMLLGGIAFLGFRMR